MQGQPVELLGLPDHALYRERWPLLETAPRAWTQLVPGNAAFISEQLSRRLNVRVGDVIEVPAPGGTWELDIVGIYADYGNPKGQLAVNVAALIRQFPQTPQTRIGLIVPRDKIPGLISALQKQFSLDDRSVADQATVKAESIRIFNRTFAVTSALNAFTLGVAGIALLTSLLTLANSRLPQLAPLWAIGITRPRLAAIELTKTLSVALFTSLLARSARTAGGMVPDRDRQREGVRLSSRSMCSAATGRAGRRRADRFATCRAAPGVAAGADAAGEPGQGVCR